MAVDQHRLPNERKSIHITMYIIEGLYSKSSSYDLYTDMGDIRTI